MVRIDGDFEKISARSEAPYKSHHVTLKEILKTNQEEFYFNDIKGSLICVYYPDYMDGINAPGWHLHFVSDDRKKGGHVFDLVMKRGPVLMDKLNRIEIQFPKEAAFDTYSLKSLAKEEIKEVEQGK
jgi:acetolactate decarboxylase